MKKPGKKINNGLIVMSKGERVGVISLLSVIAVLLAFSVFRPAIHFSNRNEKAFHNLDSMIALQERAAQQRIDEQLIATVEKPGKSMVSASPGIANKTANSPGKPTTAPVKPSASTNKTSSHYSKTIPVLDLNDADSLALVELPQIGEVMASRMQRYRERLGGFVSFDQLYEIKGMDSARYSAVKPYLLLENHEVRKLDVNRDEFKTLLRHPYLEYDQVKAIVNYRERKGLIKNWKQFQEIVGEINPLFEQYVEY